MYQSVNDLYKKYTDEEYKQLQEKFDKGRKIKFEGDIKIKSLGDILDHLFGAPAHSYKITKTTYSRGGHQCDAGRSRSLEDIYKMSRYYELGLSLKQVHSGINKALENGLYKNYCPTVKKVVHCKGYMIKKTFNEILT